MGCRSGRCAAYSGTEHQKECDDQDRQEPSPVRTVLIFSLHVLALHSNEGVVETDLGILVKELTNHTSMARLVPDLMLIGASIKGQYRCSQKVVMFIISREFGRNQIEQISESYQR